MNLKKVNQIFGYSLFAIGVIRIIYVIIVMLKAFQNVTIIFAGGNASLEYFPVLSTIIGFAEMFLAIGSIIMIILNLRKGQFKIIIGYGAGLLALLVELIVPSFLAIISRFIESSIYMWAGNKVVKANADYKGVIKTSRKIVKNTDWFYSNNNDIHKKENQIKEEVQKEQVNPIKKEIPIKEENIEDDFENDEDIGKKEKILFALLFGFIVIILIICIIFAINLLNKEDNQPESYVSNYIENYSDRVEEKDNNSKVEIQIDDRLTQITNIFNNCNTVKQMIAQGYTMSASARTNGITISSSGNGLYYTVEFELNNDILSTQIEYDKQEYRNSLIKLYLALPLVDSVGQMKGYADKTLFNALNKEEAKNYTLENEGVEIKNAPNSKDIIIRVDLNSDFSFLNQ